MIRNRNISPRFFCTASRPRRELLFSPAANGINCLYPLSDPCQLCEWERTPSYIVRDLKAHQDVITTMTKTMAHRGPDAGGVWIGRHVGLGHRRFAIIDLAGGVQPMQVEEERRTTVSLIYTGEVYNFAASCRRSVACYCSAVDIAELCRREGIAESLYYTWSKEFLEAGKWRLAGDTERAAISGEVKDLRREAWG
jgi:Glutamine amidotransferase domain